MRILIIDDSVGTCLAMVNLLKKMGYRDSEAVHSGEEGIRKLKTKPDVIFLDIMMVGMSGLDTLSNIRKHGYTGRVYMVSAIDDMEAIGFCLANGATDYIVKTKIDIPLLRKCIKGE